MKSADRVLFGVTIKQNTKEGQSLSITDLLRAYERARYIHGWSDRRLNDILSSRGTQERMYYILHERGFIKAEIHAFIEMIDKEGIVNVLKGLGVWKTKGRGENKSVYCDPYIWVLLAMEFNPMIYAKVVIWLTDSLIFDRVLAGTEYRPMNESISKIIQEPNYPLYAREINLRVFGRHEKGIRDTATAEELRKIADIEKFIGQSINLGMCQTEAQVVRIIQNYKLAGTFLPVG